MMDFAREDMEPGETSFFSLWLPLIPLAGMFGVLIGSAFAAIGEEPKCHYWPQIDVMYPMRTGAMSSIQIGYQIFVRTKDGCWIIRDDR